jgi:hypothetical protein
MRLLTTTAFAALLFGYSARRLPCQRSLQVLPRRDVAPAPSVPNRKVVASARSVRRPVTLIQKVVASARSARRPVTLIQKAAVSARQRASRWPLLIPASSAGSRQTICRRTLAGGITLPPAEPSQFEVG